MFWIRPVARARFRSQTWRHGVFQVYVFQERHIIIYCRMKLSSPIHGIYILFRRHVAILFFPKTCWYLIVTWWLAAAASDALVEQSARGHDSIVRIRNEYSEEMKWKWKGNERNINERSNINNHISYITFILPILFPPTFIRACTTI